MAHPLSSSSIVSLLARAPFLAPRAPCFVGAHALAPLLAATAHLRDNLQDCRPSTTPLRRRGCRMTVGLISCLIARRRRRRCIGRSVRPTQVDARPQFGKPLQAAHVASRSERAPRATKASSAAPPRDLWSIQPQRCHFASERSRRIGAWSGTEQIGTTPKHCGPGESNFFQLKGLLEPREVQIILTCAMASKAYAEIPDSVDHQPSFEYYPLCDGIWTDQNMQAALDDIIQCRILPYIREQYACPSCTVGTVLVRRYRQNERRTHAVHFDSQALVTAVLGLSDPADFDGGLYLQPGPSASSRLFPRIEPGDLLVHSFDLQHGVHISRGERYSLVLWLKDSPDSVRDGTTPWLEALAARGDAHATHLLGESYEFGDFGRPRDVRMAVELYERSAAAGHHWSQNSLGYLCQMRAEQEVGEVAQRCLRFSAKWFHDAAERGFAEAQRNLALTYLEGAAAEPDPARAVAWMRKAAEQLDLEAAHELGEMLLVGSPDGRVPPDRREARRWLERAARAGFVASRRSLAALDLEESRLPGLGREAKAGFVSEYFSLDSEDA